MAEYNPREELVAMQQSPQGVECQLHKEIEENVAILCHLFQCEQVGEKVPCKAIQQTLKK